MTSCIRGDAAIDIASRVRFGPPAEGVPGVEVSACGRWARAARDVHTLVDLKATAWVRLAIDAPPGRPQLMRSDSLSPAAAAAAAWTEDAREITSNDKREAGEAGEAGEALLRRIDSAAVAHSSKLAAIVAIVLALVGASVAMAAFGDRPSSWRGRGDLAGDVGDVGRRLWQAGVAALDVTFGVSAAAAAAAGAHVWHCDM